MFENRDVFNRDILNRDIINCGKQYTRRALLAVLVVMAVAAGFAAAGGVWADRAYAAEEKVTTLSAKPWNNAVELTWEAPEGCDSFSVFRREGKDAAPAKPELDEYVFLETLSTAGNSDWNHENGFSDTFYSDHYAENGKTYSYIVICGDYDTQYAGNPSKSVQATPKASLRKKPAAPYWLSLAGSDEGIGLTWNWNEKCGRRDPAGSGYEEQNPSGEGEVDHFNIYQNGRLVKQVQQQAVVVSEPYNGRVSYFWETRVKVKEYEVPYTFYVTAVAPDGTESAPSKKITDWMQEEKDVEISGYNVSYTSEEVYDEQDPEKLVTTHTGFSFSFSCVGVNYFKVWRKAAGASDDEYTKVDLITTPQEKTMDTGVKKGKVYDYKVIGVASDGQESDPVFITVAADNEDYEGTPGGSNMNLYFRTSDGETALIKCNVYRDGTYKLYRDGKLLKSWKNPEAVIEQADDPGADGRYEYWITWTSTQYPAVTVKSETRVFVRDTSDPDPDSFDKAPGKPKLTGRVLGYDTANWLQIMWEPSREGGRPDGYVIYRTDGGVYNTHEWDCSLAWGNPKRNAGEAANGRYWCTEADVNKFAIYGFDKNSNNGDSEHQENNPHRIWIQAYNEVGYSEPSEVLEYTCGEDGLLPWDTDEAAPQAPENISIWCEWKPSKYELDPPVLNGKLYVTWSAPSAGGDVDHYDVVVTHPGEQGDDYTIAEGNDKFTVKFGGEQKCTLPLYDYYVGMPFTAKVTAVNSKGEAAAEPVSAVITSIPALKVETAGKNSIMLSWTGLLGSEKDKVKEFQLYRRANASAWKKIQTKAFGEPEELYTYTDTGLDANTTYEYYVAAIDQDGKAHKSDAAAATLNNMDAPFDAPANLKAKVVKGDVILSWTPSDAGGLPAYYRMDYQKVSDDPEEDLWYSLDLTDSFGMSTGAAITSMNLYSNSDEISEMIQNYGGEKLRIRVRAIPARGIKRDSSDPSNTIEITWPTEAQIKHEKYPPHPITPEAEAGDGKVTLRWNKPAKLDAEESEATYYQVVRTWGSNYGVVATFPADQDSYEWVDTDVVNGEKYTYELRPCSSYYYSYYSSKWWYHQWCYMHQVQVIPNGKTNDQKIAENIKAFAEELIAARPASLDNITEEYHSRVMELRDNYAGTTAYQRRLIGKDFCGQIETLIDDVLYYDAEKKYAADPRLIEAITAIDGLDAYPADIGLTAEDWPAFAKAVKAARAAYDALPDDARKLVANYGKLTDREAYIKRLNKEAADQAKADSLSDRMEALTPETITPETLTDELEREIRDLRMEYDALTKGQKARVRPDALKNLEAAEEAAGLNSGTGPDDPVGPDDPIGPDDPVGPDDPIVIPPDVEVGMILSETFYTWDGQVKTPDIFVFRDGAVLDPSQYELALPKGRVNVGTYTVMATIPGEEPVTVEANFEIDPKGAKILKPKKAKKAIVVKWKRQKAKMSERRITGYQIEYSRSKEMTDCEIVNVKGWKKTSKKIRGLKKKKTYYVQVRTCFEADGQFWFSPWSTVKRVKL